MVIPRSVLPGLLRKGRIPAVIQVGGPDLPELLMHSNERAPRIVLAKVGLDGHDRGIKVVARGLRDAGCHVIYAGLWQQPEAVVRTVGDEDADWLGISILSGAHMTLMPRIMELLKAAGLTDVRVMVGGIIPEEDISKLMELGVERVFGPGTSIPEIVQFVKRPAEAGRA